MNVRSRLKLSDRIGGMTAFLLGSLSLWEAGKLVKYRTGDWTGDHVFPFLLGILLCACGLLLALRPGAYPNVNSGSEAEEEPSGKTEAYGIRDRIRIAAVPGLLLGYAMLLPYAGYAPATWAASFVLFCLIGSYRWFVSAAAAGLLTAGLDLLFVEWLHTPLPTGVWFVS